jgi:Xaa-Pro aminopeptidase
MFTPTDYINRRNKLKSKIKSGLLLFMGNEDSPMNYPGNIFPFRQDSNYLYFFGIDQPNFGAIIDLDSGDEIIYGNKVDIEDIIWMGPQPSVKDQAAAFGITNTKTRAQLDVDIREAVSKGRKIHFLPPYRYENKIFIQENIGIRIADQKEKASMELIKAVIDIRSTKEEKEIQHIDSIMDVAYEMHTTAMKLAQEGVYEREIHGRIEGIAMSYGGRVSFPVILSKRGETLHNHLHGNLLKNKDLLLVDAGFESTLHYATDHTRTIPVGGTFTQKQREIYQIVVDAKDEATKLIKPGTTYYECHMMAAKTIAKGLSDLGMIKGDLDEAVKAGAHTLFFPHGLGHMMGLDVHDMEDIGETFVGYDETIQRSSQFGTAYLRMARKLEPGFIITNEPGIYFIPALIDKWINEKINHEFINFDKVNEYRDFGGIRLEDDILVTETGARNMGKKQIPITIDEVQSIAGKGL